MKTTLAATFAAIAALVAGGVASIYWIGGHTMDRQTELAVRTNAIDELNTALSTLTDAETGQRGYLLTQKLSYLAPFDSALDHFPEQLARLRRSLRYHDETSPDFNQFVSLSFEKLDELRKTVDLARSGHLDQALEIVRSDQGNELMDRIRDRVTKIEEQEQRRVEAAQRALERAGKQRNEVFIAVALINLLFIGWAYQRIRRETNERTNALKEIERQKDLLDVTLLSIGDAVIVTDLEGRITSMNKVAEELTGWPFDEARSLPCEAIFRIVNEETRKTVENPVSRVLREGVTAGLANHTLLLRRDGSEIPIDDSGAPIRERTGELRGVVLIFRDFSEHKLAEKALRIARDELDMANRAKSQFFAALSHELRTPSTPVLATLSLWEGKDSFPESLRADVRMMRRNIELQVRLIDELIDLNRITKGRVSLRLEVADVHALISSVLGMYASEIYSRGVNYTTDLAAGQPYVNCDLDRLQQVFWNILKNAAIYTLKGGHIYIRSFNIGSSICIAFKDTGIGMSPETVRNLFKPFEAKTPVNFSRSEGLGLGLSISQALVHQQGGEITARSDGVGMGSEFMVRLPSAAEPVRKSAALAESPSALPAAPTQQQRILLVEDHADTAKVMAMVLSNFGYEVDIAGTSVSALGLYRQKDYHAVLSDLGLPDGSGIDLVQKMKQIKDIPAIALTGFGTEEDIVSSQRTGFIQHLTKPVNVQQLKAALDRLPTSRL